MKPVLSVLAAFLMVMGAAAQPLAQDTILDTVAKGCAQELATYCKDVTPGEGRVLACLFAHQDKLGGPCEYALYDAAVRLERAVNALSFVAGECQADLETHCRGIKAGEGRLLECLQQHDAQVSQRCKEARKQVGLE
jgi:hypothetical protein